MITFCVMCEYCKRWPASPPMHDHAPNNPEWFECRFTSLNFVTGVYEGEGERCDNRNHGDCRDFRPRPIGETA